ncbi:CPBP family intramembrane glutamic endopeptidase [Pseudonocardia sp. TRM90224]|uniref:CPBP family intramembrane glutamic endopeptidase n=1 Tax=Pseudonocardia sp. TRM90224 TaxID=2812678 RepID=UPI001E58C899|nr:type II CAAX endopeptidase family protein [Pseudonocardia sp. TRM90224]
MTSHALRTRSESSGSWIRDLAPFFAVTFGISWGLWAVALALGGKIADPVVYWLYVIGACGPSLAALVLRVAGGRSARVVRWSAAPVWLPAALALGVAPAVITVVVAPMLGAPAFDPATVSTIVTSVGGVLPMLALFLIAGPLAEEFGWRGYAQPRLRRHLSPAGTSLVLGTIWGLWHIPLYLLVGTGQSAKGLFSVAALLFFGTAPVLSVGFWFVSERLRGGSPAAVLMHLTMNMGLALLAATGSVVGGLVYLAVSALIAAVLLAWRRLPG